MAVALGLSCGDGEVAAVDPAETTEAALLRDYLRIDTSNPPGNETAGARWLAARLEDHGIETRLLGGDPSRQAVYARLESGKDLPALLLTHHIDVVPAEPAEWEVDPFAAEAREGYIWGRGAIDDKSLGMAQLLAMVEIGRDRQRLVRDVIFLGVPDEETGGLAGTAAVLEEYPELFENVGFVLNEGGGNQVVVDETIFWGIEIDQKVPLWVELVAKAQGGHGALVHSDSAINRLLLGLAQLPSLPAQRTVTPAVRSYFESVSRVKKGQKARVLAEIDRYYDSPRLASVLPEAYLGLLQDTWNITVLDAGRSVNVVPEVARAEIDGRLVPGSNPEQALENLRKIVGDRVQVNVMLAGKAAPPSPVDTELWRILEQILSREEPGSVVGPMVALGTTDSRFYRERGIVAYGFSPFKINFYDGATVHGPNEKIRAQFFLEGVSVMKDVVRRFAVAQ